MAKVNEKKLSEKVTDGAKYIGFAQPIGGLLTYFLLRGTGATVEDVITVAAGMTALTNIVLIIFNYYFKIF